MPESSTVPDRGFKRRDGSVVPYREWVKIGRNFSIMPLKTTCRLRDDVTGEVVIPRGPAARDALGMSLYRHELPVGYIRYCFGAWGDALLKGEDPALFSKLY